MIMHNIGFNDIKCLSIIINYAPYDICFFCLCPLSFFSADGRVLKAINRGFEGNIESVVIEDMQVLAKDEPVKELKIFYKSGEGKLIVVSKKNIVSIPLHRCEKQITCG